MVSSESLNHSQFKDVQSPPTNVTNPTELLWTAKTVPRERKGSLDLCQGSLPAARELIRSPIGTWKLNRPTSIVCMPRGVEVKISEKST